MAIFLENHNESIEKEFKAFLKNSIRNEQIEEDLLMNTDTVSRVCFQIAEAIEKVFKENTLAFLIRYGVDHDLTFKQLQTMIGIKQNSPTENFGEQKGA